ncbi:phosphoribosylanthranilate isomerase [Lacipirellula sp.]|uniref:phosphoribosylanthranilate isomerase n=1 Tax=Lacipirellula sp. TaxID=2691419 RepID=UPI003D0B9A41
MFRIKVCGITNVEDAIAAVDAGADALGLNFYEKSSRCVSPVTAKRIVEAVLGRAKAWGVFVNLQNSEIEQLTADVGLDGVQLHGDETPRQVADMAKRMRAPAFPGRQKVISKFSAEEQSRLEGKIPTELFSLPSSVIRARRMDERGVGAIRADLDDCVRAGGLPGAVLVDAATPGRYGGTGETVSWVGLIDYTRWLGLTPLILAGGLRPDNVAEAIRTVRPFGVDVASGVESAPGKKDHAKVRDFVAAARAAF